MIKEKIKEELIEFISKQGFNAPYGIIDGQGTSKNGKEFLSIIFGRPRTLDAEIKIFGDKFLTLRTSRGNQEVYKSVEDLEKALLGF